MKRKTVLETVLNFYPIYWSLVKNTLEDVFFKKELNFQQKHKHIEFKFKISSFVQKVYEILQINYGLPVQEETVTGCCLGWSPVGAWGSDNKQGLL